MPYWKNTPHKEHKGTKLWFEITYRRAAQTPAGDSMAVTFIYADFGLAFIESTAICPRQGLCALAL